MESVFVGWGIVVIKGLNMIHLDPNVFIENLRSIQTAEKFNVSFYRKVFETYES